MIEGLEGIAAAKDVVGGSARGVLIDFWSPWCAPCRVLRPHLHRLAEEHRQRWRFVALDTEAHPGAADAFRLSGVPTLLLFRAGREVARLSGGITLGALVSKLEETDDVHELDSAAITAD